VSWSARRRRQASAGIAALGLAVALLAGCSDGRDARTEERVVWRLSELSRDARGFPLRAARAKIGTATRSAIRVPAPSSIEVEVPPTSGRLVLSLGVPDDGSSELPLTFAVSAGVEGDWHPVLIEEISAGQWEERTVDLGGSAGVVSRLRLQIFVDADEGGPEEALWGSVCLLAAGDPRAEEDPSSLPSIVLISLDTLGAGHLSSFGGVSGVSLHLDAIFARAFSFRRAYAQYPSTLSSHASLFAGCYPRTHGLYAILPRGEGYEPLAALLASHGYLTAATTENAFVGAGFGFDHGFDFYDDGQLRGDYGFPGNSAQTFAGAREWITRYGTDTRFFLFVHTYEVHAPYVVHDLEARQIADRVTPGYDGPYDEGFVGPELLRLMSHNRGNRMEAGEVARLRGLYTGEIYRLDRQVSELVAAIERLDSERPVLVVITSDHGEEFDEHERLGHGETLHNPALHVPLVFLWPGRIDPGASTRPVELVDVMPTLLELVGLPVPTGIDGESLAPIIQGESDGAHLGAAFSELRSSPGECALQGRGPDCLLDRVAVQDERFKLISSRLPPFDLLYDLQQDPGETRDVAPKFPAELQRLRDEVDAYRRRGSGAEIPRSTGDLDPETEERLRALGYLP
jgi:arylsulfatase A-like enzyme